MRTNELSLDAIGCRSNASGCVKLLTCTERGRRRVRSAF